MHSRTKLGYILSGRLPPSPCTTTKMPCCAHLNPVFIQCPVALQVALLLDRAHRGPTWGC